MSILQYLIYAKNEKHKLKLMFWRLSVKYCALCCIAKDEDIYIKEWVEYHLLLGFDAIIIYDNHSAVPLRDVLKMYVSDGRVIVHATEGAALGEKAQGAAYTHCMQTYKDAFIWIAVVDVDEVIVPKECENIKQMLAEFENYGGVVLNWVFYADSSEKKYFANSQINSFLYKNSTRSTTIKSIVRPKRVKEFTGPHGPLYLEPYYAVNMDHFPLEPDVYSAPYAVERAQINHYNLRTKDDWQRKVAKWKLSGLILSKDYDAAVKEYINYDSFCADLYARLRNHKSAAMSADFSSVAEMAEFFINALKIKKLHNTLNVLLCDCACIFPDDPMIWYFRSVLARQNGLNDLALHFIKQASKLSGSSTVYFEVARVYDSLGQSELCVRANEQALYKKHVEETTCE